MVERLHLKMKKLGFSICVGSQYSNLAGLAYTEKLSCNAASTWSLDHHRQARGLSTCKARAGRWTNVFFCNTPCCVFFIVRLIARPRASHIPLPRQDTTRLDAKGGWRWLKISGSFIIKLCVSA